VTDESEIELIALVSGIYDVDQMLNVITIIVSKMTVTAWALYV